MSSPSTYQELQVRGGNAPMAVNFGEAGSVVVNRGPGILSYGDTEQSARTPEGTIAVDASATLTETQYLLSTLGSRLGVTGISGVAASAAAIAEAVSAEAAARAAADAVLRQMKGVAPFRATHDPVDYGASYNGVVNDAPGCNAAIDAASALGGGIVEVSSVGGLHLSSRRVRITDDVVVEDGVWFRGRGSTTTFTGVGSIRIPGAGALLADRIQMSDFTIQPSGSQVALSLDNIDGIGGLQLGWPRISVENVTIIDPVGIGLLITLGIVIECRLTNVIVMRNQAIGIAVSATDNFLVACTVGGASQAPGQSGIALAGGNNHLSACKSYGQAGSAFALAGAGRHTLAACEAQDSLVGFDIQSFHNTVQGIADTCSKYGVYFAITTERNIVDVVVASAGGGGTGAITPVGAFFDVGSRWNQLNIATNATVAVAGDLAGNSIHVNGQDGMEALTYAATVTPDLRKGRIKTVTLTGNVAFKAPHECWPGVRLVLMCKQDGSGAHTISFDSCYRLAVGWSPGLAADQTDVVEFEHDGTFWRQVGWGALTDRAALAEDNFTRADGALGSAPTGGAWSTSDAKMVVGSNKAYAPTATPFTESTVAWVDVGVSDATVQATMLDSQASLVFRLADATNYYLWDENGIVRIADGVGAGIAVGGSFTAGDVLKVRCVGATAFCYKNGTLVTVAALPRTLGATKFGVGVVSPASLGVDTFTVT